MSKDYKLGVTLSAKDGMSSKLGIATKSVNRFEKRISKLGGSMIKLGIATTGASVAIAASLGKTVSSFQEVERAKGELSSLDIGELGLSKIGKEAQIFSNTFAGTTKAQFISAAYDIKSGISSLSDEGVAKFTALASMTAAATKSSAAEMTKLFALGHGIFGKDFGSDFEFGEKFSAAISGAVKAFRTDGSDLTLGISNIGAAAHSMGVTLAEELSIIGVAKSSFNTAAEAGTGYRAFLVGVGKAQKKLGLDFKDSQGHLLPMVEILGKIKSKFGDLSKVENSDKLKDAFGSDEAVKLIKGLIDKTDELSDSQKTLNSHMQNGTRLTREMAEKMNRGKDFELLGQQVNNASSAIGSIFAPTALRMGVIIGKTTQKLTKWIDTHREEATAIGKVVMAITAGIAAFGTFAITLGLAVKTGIMFVNSTLGIAKGLFLFGKALVWTTRMAFGLAGVLKGTLLFSLKLAGRTILWMGRALLANPIGLAVTAIAGGAYLIYSNWGKLKGWFTSLWGNIKTSFSNAWESIKTFASNPIEGIKSLWTGFAEWFVSIPTRIVTSMSNAFDGLVDIVKSPIESIKGMWTDLMGFIDGKLSWFDGAMDTVNSGWKATKSFFGFGEDEASTQGNKPNMKVVTKKVLTTAMAVPVMAAASSTPSSTTAVPSYMHQQSTSQVAQVSTELRGVLQNQQLQIKSNNDIIASVARRPEQHTYHITVTVNNPRNTDDVQSAVMRAVKEASRKGAQKKLGDIE